MQGATILSQLVAWEGKWKDLAASDLNSLFKICSSLFGSEAEIAETEKEQIYSICFRLLRNLCSIPQNQKLIRQEKWITSLLTDKLQLISNSEYTSANQSRSSDFSHSTYRIYASVSMQLLDKQYWEPRTCLGTLFSANFSENYLAIISWGHSCYFISLDL